MEHQKHRWTDSRRCLSPFAFIAVALGMAGASLRPAAAQLCFDEFAGDCCTATLGTPRCHDATCADAVEACDPYCCNVEWDALCVLKAEQLCDLDCGQDVCIFAGCTGSCCSAQSSKGCSNTMCCQTVCACDPYCCDTKWDAACAREADLLCGITCGAQSCCAAECTSACKAAADLCCSDQDCDDGTFCSGVETCVSGSCQAGSNPCPGPDGDADCSESCDESASNCNGDDPNGVACDDGDPYTNFDICSAGVCAGTTIDCNENGIPDHLDIAARTSDDINENERPDECEDPRVLVHARITAALAQLEAETGGSIGPSDIRFTDAARLRIQNAMARQRNIDSLEIQENACVAKPESARIIGSLNGAGADELRLLRGPRLSTPNWGPSRSPHKASEGGET